VWGAIASTLGKPDQALKNFFFLLVYLDFPRPRTGHVPLYLCLHIPARVHFVSAMAQHKWDERGVETGWCSHCVTLSEHTRQVAPLASPRVPDVAPAAVPSAPLSTRERSCVPNAGDDLVARTVEKRLQVQFLR